MHVLLACNEPIARRLGPVLRAQGWDPVVAPDVPTALMAAKRRRPDAVVVTEVLPGGRGSALVARLRALAATAFVPVVGLVDGPADAAALQEAGAERQLPVGADPEQLVAVLAGPAPAPTAAPAAVVGPASPAVAAPPAGHVVVDALPLVDRAARVMVVEDDPSLRTLLLHVLELEDHEVAAFGSAEPALAACRASLPDVLLLDVELPDRSGLEVLTELQADPVLRSIPVLFVSGRDDHTVVEALRAGARDYIRKPFDVDELLARVEAAVVAGASRPVTGGTPAPASPVATDPPAGRSDRVDAALLVGRAVAQARRSGGALSLLRVDVDGFRDINDAHGRAVGDEILRAVDQRLVHTLRGADQVFRWGGAGFLLLLPGTDTTGARLAADRLREAIAGVGLPPTASGDHPVGPLTVGIGIATLQDGSGQLLADAEEALRRAKAAGRGRVAASAARNAQRAVGGLLAAGRPSAPAVGGRLVS